MRTFTLKFLIIIAASFIDIKLIAQNSNSQCLLVGKWEYVKNQKDLFTFNDDGTYKFESFKKENNDVETLVYKESGKYTIISLRLLGLNIDSIYNYNKLIQSKDSIPNEFESEFIFNLDDPIIELTKVEKKYRQFKGKANTLVGSGFEQGSSDSITFLSQTRAKVLLPIMQANQAQLCHLDFLHESYVITFIKSLADTPPQLYYWWLEKGTLYTGKVRKGYIKK